MLRPMRQLHPAASKTAYDLPARARFLQAKSRSPCAKVESNAASFFFNPTATTEIYTLSLHDALPICAGTFRADGLELRPLRFRQELFPRHDRDRKSTRLNSSHQIISYAVFCLKK